MDRSALTALGIPADAIVAGFVGNIRPVKGVRYLLEAMSKMNPDLNVHLLLVGTIRDPAIERMAKRNDHVHCVGFRRDATQLIGACDLTVMPSIEREGLPKAVLEAMAQGVAPIVTRVGGLPELVEDGTSGLLVPPRNAPALCEAITSLATDTHLRKRLGDAAKARIEGPFNIAQTVEKTLAFYQQVLSGKSS